MVHMKFAWSRDGTRHSENWQANSQQPDKIPSTDGGCRRDGKIIDCAQTFAVCLLRLNEKTFDAVRLKDEIVHHLRCLTTCKRESQHASRPSTSRALAPSTPAFNIDFFFFSLLAIPPPCDTRACAEQRRLNIERGGARGAAQVVHYFVLQPLAPRAFF